MGRADGLCRGLGGSMHLVDVEHGLLGATGVVGGNVPIAARQRARGAAARRRPGRGRVLRRRRGTGGALQRVGQPGDAVGAAGGVRVREQRLRRVHAALGAHERRARERRGRPVRRDARHGRRQRRGGRVGRLRPLPRRGPRRPRADAARVPYPPAARPLRGRPGALPRGDRRGRVAGRRTRSCGSSAARSRRLDRRGGRRGDRARGRRGGRRRPSGSRARARSRRAELRGAADLRR